MSFCVDSGYGIERKTEKLITHNPLLFAIAQGVSWLPWERLLRSTLHLIEGGYGSLYSRTLLAVPRWLNNCYLNNADSQYVMSARNHSCWLKLHIVHYPMYTVTLNNFSCNGKGHKNYPGPCNHDLLHRPLLIFSICLVIPEPGGVGSGASSSWLPKERFRLLAYDYMCKSSKKA